MRRSGYIKNKKKYNIFILIIVIIVTSTFIIGSKKNSKSDAYIVENEVAIETISNDESTIEPVEDEQIKKIVEDLIEDKGLTTSDFSLFYYNIDLEKYYFYNENTYFTAASTIKMPIAMLYYDKIRNGELNLDDTITYTSDCYEAGSGTTDYIYSVGSNVPINFLLEQSIVNSDNTAINILIKNLEYENCKQQIAKYSTIELDENFYSSNIINARYAYDIVNHLYKNLEDYSELLDYLKKSSNGQYLKKYIEDYDVAHKYGSYNGYVHDYGIVFGETNYLIGIFTKNIANADEFIADTSLKIFNEVNKES